MHEVKPIILILEANGYQRTWWRTALRLQNALLLKESDYMICGTFTELIYEMRKWSPKIVIFDCAAAHNKMFPPSFGDTTKIIKIVDGDNPDDSVGGNYLVKPLTIEKISDLFKEHLVHED